MASKIAQIRKRADKDYYFFCKHVLGYDKMRPSPHQKIADFLQPVFDGTYKKSGNRKKLLMSPRGSFKSSVATVGGPLWALTKNPNLRILIAGETQKNAKKFVKEIKTHIESNDKFKAVYGNWVPKENIWRDDEFIINKRKAVKKESTVMAASLEKQSITGQHYDLIILDDPVSFNNINTPEQLQKTIDFYKMLLSVLEPDGAIVVVGTKYTVQDLYGWLTDEESPEKGQIDSIILEAIDDEGVLLFPEVLTKEFLEDQKKTQGEFIYTCQYLNRAISPDTCFFKQENIKFYETLPEGLIYFITFDPAISQKQRSDYSAFIVNGVDYNHNWYIAEAIQKKLSPSELIDLIFFLVKKYNPMCVAMETFMLEQMFKINLMAEMEKRQISFPLKELPQDTRISKENRIRALEPRFQNGQVFIHKTQNALYHQIAYYPLGTKHDDLLDALKSQLQITYPSPHYTEPPKENKHLSEFEKKIWDDVKKIGTRKVHRKGYTI